jgi:RNA polymerase sigma factor (sigma-70 family)
MAAKIEDEVARAQGGSQAALTEVVRQSQDRIYHLALRMLADPVQAEDATQDILILLVTKLGSFRGESSFLTWSYRVAVNHLLSAQKIRARDPGLSFDLFAADLADGLVDETAASAEDVVLLNELRVGCTMAMLLCLDMAHRLAYVLGDVLELDHRSAAEIASVPSATHRQRLARARARVQAFTAQHCGVVSAGATCSCPRRLPAAQRAGRVGRAGTAAVLSRDAPEYQAVLYQVAGVEKDLRAMKAQQAMAAFSSPRDFAAHLEDILTPPPV